MSAERRPAVSPSGARCTGLAGHSGEHYDAARSKFAREAAAGRTLLDAIETHESRGEPRVVTAVHGCHVQGVTGPGEVTVAVTFDDKDKESSGG